MQRLIVRDFMAVNQAELEVANTLLLIGEQASGKSTLAKLIYFFKSLRDEYVALLVDSDGPDLHLQRAFWALIGKKFYRIFGSIQKLAKFDIKYYFSEQKHIHLCQGEFPDGRKKLVITISGNDWYYELTQGEGKRLLQQLHRYSEKRFDFESAAYRRTLRDVASFTFRSFVDDTQTLVFHPAGRNATVAFNDFFEQAFSQSLAVSIGTSDSYGEDEFSSPIPTSSATKLDKDIYLMYQFMRHVANIKTVFRGNDFESLIGDKIAREFNGSNSRGNPALPLLIAKVNQILKGTYDHSNYEKIKFDGGEVSLTDASSGQQEVIRILQDIFLVVLNKEKGCRIIEEPEAHLFPTAQKLLLEMIALMINSTNSQIVLTTHSPYILSVINILLFTHQVKGKDDQLWLEPDQCRVYALTSDGHCHSVLDTETKLIDQNVLDSVSLELANHFNRLYQMFLET
ncbi:MAG: AAA family ATPase [Ardenticatenales bacterium]|nr:AAA family ATPase [Ardenticatenales bacterium]